MKAANKVTQKAAGCPPWHLQAMLCLLLSLLVAQCFAAQEGYPFEVITQRAGSFHRVVARNDGPAPITAKIALDSDTAASDRTWPVTITVAPGQEIPLGKIFAARPGQEYSFRTSYSWRMGEISAPKSSGVSYRLPFADGLSFPIAQAFGGPQATHTTLDSFYAVDFTMPEGTLIVAARAGTVIEVKSHYREGRLDPALAAKANGVLIAHDDGTLGRYAHFMAGPPLVRPGQRVQSGSPIGYSGNTGYSGGPHLHFAVSRVVVRADGNLDEESLPVTFYAFDPAIRFAPQTGIVVSADYTHAGKMPVAKESKLFQVGNAAPTGAQ